MLKIYHGGCHCGDIRYSVDLDLSRGTMRCNCTYCRKVRNWSAACAPEALAITGEDKLASYTLSGAVRHEFCPRCGVRLFSRGHMQELGGDFASVMVSTLDEGTEDELIAAPVKWADGLHDNWRNSPLEVRYL